jgi:hypothetical protein
MRRSRKGVRLGFHLTAKKKPNLTPFLFPFSFHLTAKKKPNLTPFLSPLFFSQESVLWEFRVQEAGQLSANVYMVKAKKIGP